MGCISCRLGIGFRFPGLDRLGKVINFEVPLLWLIGDCFILCIVPILIYIHTSTHRMNVIGFGCKIIPLMD